MVLACQKGKIWRVLHCLYCHDRDKFWDKKERFETPCLKAGWRRWYWDTSDKQGSALALPKGAKLSDFFYFNTGSETIQSPTLATNRVLPVESYWKLSECLLKDDNNLIFLSQNQPTIVLTIYWLLLGSLHVRECQQVSLRAWEPPNPMPLSSVQKVWAKVAKQDNLASLPVKSCCVSGRFSQSGVSLN